MNVFKSHCNLYYYFKPMTEFVRIETLILFLSHSLREKKQKKNCLFTKLSIYIFSKYITYHHIIFIILL